MDYLCEMTDLILEVNPRVVDSKHVESSAKRIRVVTLP